MEEIQNPSVSGQEEVNDSIDYISALNEMKQNSVSKEAYNKLKQENKKLLESLVTGKELDPSQIPEKPDIQKLRKELYGGEKELDNLEYVTKTLQLRKALMDEGQEDPFLPVGSKAIIEGRDYDTVEKVAQTLQELVDYANGDSAIFTTELQRVMVDSPAITAKIASKSRRR